jgi:hypothetical protein
MAIDWNDGRLITLSSGDTATCTSLNSQLYGLMFYNSAGHDTETKVLVNWSNSQPPATVVVPGTTLNQGLAAVLFVSGNDTTTVAASILQGNPGTQVQAFIASVKMPTNTAGINNTALQADGQSYPFEKFTRFYAVPASHWYNVEIESTINQFISVLFKSQHATVSVINAVTQPGSTVSAVGSAQNQYQVQTNPSNADSYPFQGNGQQVVWVNADSVQNSQSAFISLQSLAARSRADAPQIPKPAGETSQQPSRH